MESAASSLQELTARNATLSRSLSRLSAWSGTNPPDLEERRQQLRRELDDVMQLGKQLASSLKDASASPARDQRATSVNQRQKRKLQTILEKELRKTQALVADMARIEKRWLASISPRPSAARDDVKEETFVESASTPLLAQEQVEIDIASEMALRAAENEQEIQVIERDVAELNDMFKDMSFLVEQQQETLDCIEDNIASTATYTRQGYQEVEKVYLMVLVGWAQPSSPRCYCRHKSISGVPAAGSVRCFSCC